MMSCDSFDQRAPHTLSPVASIPTPASFTRPISKACFDGGSNCLALQTCEPCSACVKLHVKYSQCLGTQVPV